MTVGSVASKVAIGAGIAAGIALTYVVVERQGGVRESEAWLKRTASKLPTEEIKSRAENAVRASQDVAVRVRRRIEEAQSKPAGTKDSTRPSGAKGGDSSSAVAGTAASVPGRLVFGVGSAALGTVSSAASAGGGLLYDYAKLRAEKGASAVGSKVEDVRSSVGETMHSIERGASEMASETREATFSLFRTLLLGTLLTGLLVYIYAPERDQQIALWHRVKSFISGVSGVIAEFRPSRQ